MFSYTFRGPILSCTNSSLLYVTARLVTVQVGISSLELALKEENPSKPEIYGS